MKSFEYIIKDEVGMHARPAGALAQEAAKYKSKITIDKEGNKADVTRLMGVMAMGIKNGEKVIIEAEGEDEDAAIVAMKEFFIEKL